MSTETAYMRHLRKWLKEMERDEAQGRLSDLERADMRAMKWAVESLRVGVEAIRDAGVARSASYQAARRQEFAERRENRTQ